MDFLTFKGTLQILLVGVLALGVYQFCSTVYDSEKWVRDMEIGHQEYMNYLSKLSESEEITSIPQAIDAAIEGEKLRHYYAYGLPRLNNFYLRTPMLFVWGSFTMLGIIVFLLVRGNKRIKGS